MKTNLKRNLVLFSFLSLGLSACGSNSSNNSSSDAPPPVAPQGPVAPGNGVPAGPRADVDLQGTAYGVSFAAKGALAIEQRDHIVLLISSDEVQDCANIALGKTQINLFVPKNQAGPFNETNLQPAPKFINAPEDGGLTIAEDFVTFDISVAALTADAIDLEMDLRDDVGAVISGHIKAKICH